MPRAFQPENSTRRNRLGRTIGRRTVLIAFALVGALAAPQRAFADGDPASDVLATQSLFLPWDAGFSQTQQAQLVGLVSGARRAGAPVRVAVITSAADMGSVTQLWRKPRAYALFLGEELSLMYHGPLIVVMPNGLGFYDAGRALGAADRGTLAARAPGPGAGALLAATSYAVRRVAAASGHAINVERTDTTTRSSGLGLASWLALAAGAALIAAAWAASLRARPLRLRDHW